MRKIYTFVGAIITISDFAFLACFNFASNATKNFAIMLHIIIKRRVLIERCVESSQRRNVAVR